MLDYIWHISLEIIPVFLLAIFFSSLIDHFLPDNYFQKLLAGSPSNFLGVFLAAVLGSLVPICTCGMIPLAIKLNQKALPWTMLVAFLTAGNANSIPAMLLSSTLGFDFLLYRLIFSILFGVLTSYLLAIFLPEDFKLDLGSSCCHEDHKHKKSFWVKFLDDLKEMSLSFLPWILFAIFLAALLHSSLDINSLFAGLVQNVAGSILAPLLMAVIAFPFYFCAGADVPLAREFLSFALGMGSIMTFMLAAPGVNLTSFFVYKKAIGLKATVFYLLASIVVVTLLGIFLNFYVNYGANAN